MLILHQEHPSLHPTGGKWHPTDPVRFADVLSTGHARCFQKILDSMSAFNSWEISQEMLEFQLPLGSLRVLCLPTRPRLATLGRGCRLWMPQCWLVRCSLHVAPFARLREFKFPALESNFVWFPTLDPSLRFHMISLPAKFRRPLSEPLATWTLLRPREGQRLPNLPSKL